LGVTWCGLHREHLGQRDAGLLLELEQDGQKDRRAEVWFCQIK
jgi:hypothetical protein